MKKLIYSQEDLDLILVLELEEKDKEIERLHSIIKEAREYIELRSNTNLYDKNKLLEILKGSDKE